MDERVTYNDDGSLDEVVTSGGAHLECMDDGAWFLSCRRADGSEFCVWIEGKITMTEEREPSKHHANLVAAKDARIAELEAALERIDDLEQALYSIQQWCDAYPVDIFRQPTKDEIKAGVDALQATGVITSDRLHASWARHILNGVRGYTEVLSPASEEAGQ